MLEILLASDNPAQQNGRIDRRHLRIPHSLAGIYIRPVIEESSVIGQLFPEESERGQSTLSCRCEGDPAVFLPEAQGCQAETSGRNASHNALIINFDVASVLHQAGFWISLLPKILKIAVLQVVKELIIFL